MNISQIKEVIYYWNCIPNIQSAAANDIATAINNVGWKANAGGNVDGTSASTLVKSGEEVVFKAGDNLIVKQDLSTGK